VAGSGSNQELALLILTRRVGESIQIGDDVQFVVLGTKSNSVKIGIQAPSSTKVVRAEILDRDSDGNKSGPPAAM
jgi:carbon storage regulator